MLNRFFFFALLLVPELFGLPAARSLTVGPLLENPIGYGDTDLQFSWKLPDGQQTAWEVVCASSAELLPDRADLWVSGKRESDQSLFIDYEGERLGSGDRLYWSVRYSNNADEVSDWAEIASVEYGLLYGPDWKGKWILDPADKAGEIGYAPHFRKAFEAPAKVASTRLYFTAEGVADLHSPLFTRRLGSVIYEG